MHIFFVDAAAAATAAATAASTIAAAVAASSLWGPPTCQPRSCDQVSQCGRENGAHVASPLQLDQDWLEGEGDTGPWCLLHFRIQRRHAPVEVLAPPPQHIIEKCRGYVRG